MATKGIHKKIEEIAVDDSGNWKEKAAQRRANRDWLRKSQQVAAKVLQTLDEKEMQQKELAEVMEVSPQQISKIVKGKQNLTLQTISKLEQVLGISLFDVPRKADTVKVEPKRTGKVSYDRKSSGRYAATELLESLKKSSWNPDEQREDKLTLVA